MNMYNSAEMNFCSKLSNLSLYGPDIDKILQRVAYGYNIRGWLTDINNVGPMEIAHPALFNFRINYNRVEGDASVVPLFNGNIAQTLWRTANNDKDIRGYGYSYDPLNRIVGANSYRGRSLNTMVSVMEHNINIPSYDRNGNIQSLLRWGSDGATMPRFGKWDDLTYTYNGNQLVNVLESARAPMGEEGFSSLIYNPGIQYHYDANGNMVSDTNKGIFGITYNHLNLPEEINFGNNKKINYIYDATGVKLAKQVKDGSTISTQYAGNFIYNNAGGDLKLQFFSHSEGYVEPVSGENRVKGFGIGGPGVTYSNYKYVFQYKDHLGNVRLSYSDLNLDGAIDPSEIIEESNYYPFGLEQKGYNNDVSPSGNSLAQKTKYQGQELEEDLGKNTYAFQWRDYDPAIGRFNKIDRFAEKYVSHSPYAFSKNNPIFFREIKGDSINLAHLRDNNKEAYDKLINQLQDFTGYTLDVDDGGNVTVATEKNKRGKDKAIIRRDANGKKVGSSSARRNLSNAIGHDDTVTVLDSNGKSAVTLDDNQNYTNEINLSSTEINGATASSDLNALTNGIGMTFFHELGHTPVGGGYHDPLGAGTNGDITPGPNVRRVNRIRRQLGPSFGQRMIYTNPRINMSASNPKGSVYSAYSRQSLEQIRNGQTPTSMYFLINE